MKITTNEVLASRRRKQALAASLSGLAVLIVGLAVNLGAARAGAISREGLWAAYGALVVGSILSWTGVVLTDRWAARPRADEALAEALKGAGGGYRLFNWCLPADHVLLAPWGLAVMNVYNHEGPVRIRGKRWRDARPIARRLLSFGRRAVRDPSNMLAMETAALAKALLASDPDIGDVRVDGLAVFTHPRAVVQAEKPSVPVVLVGQMRDWLRRESKQGALPAADRRRLERALEELSRERLGLS